MKRKDARQRKEKKETIEWKWKNEVNDMNLFVFIYC